MFTHSFPPKHKDDNKDEHDVLVKKWNTVDVHIRKINNEDAISRH